ncbi:MAG TPA: aminopeptidase P family N-terminal domain-containing protein, partial [Pseudogracilibacillus sp.]|nr:aminopeptidase P family N-terminal domain-containing protein [Pseudogracilibacillus sp.]
MYETRQQKLINEIRNERQVDIALIMSPMNIYYYTGFHSEPDERFLAFVIDAKTEKTMLFYPSL